MNLHTTDIHIYIYICVCIHPVAEDALVVSMGIFCTAKGPIRFVRAARF